MPNASVGSVSTSGNDATSTSSTPSSASSAGSRAAIRPFRYPISRRRVSHPLDQRGRDAVDVDRQRFLIRVGDGDHAGRPRDARRARATRRADPRRCCSTRSARRTAKRVVDERKRDRVGRGTRARQRAEARRHITADGSTPMLRSFPIATRSPPVPHPTSSTRPSRGSSARMCSLYAAIAGHASMRSCQSAAPSGSSPASTAP